MQEQFDAGVEQRIGLVRGVAQVEPEHAALDEPRHDAGPDAVGGRTTAAVVRPLPAPPGELAGRAGHVVRAVDPRLEVQEAVLAKTRSKLQALEARLEEIEKD